MKHKPQQSEFAVASAVFNLAGETGNDPFRIEREKWEAEERRKATEEYQTKMQLTLAQCPGFIGCDAPCSENSKGRVIVEPGQVFAAMAWLKRRYHVSENLDLSPDHGLCIDLAPRVRRAGARKVRVKFDKVEQFELVLQTTESEQLKPK